MQIELFPINQITLNERQRVFFDEGGMIDLMDSITNQGLIHPIAITQDGMLLAGERRLRAITALHSTSTSPQFGGLSIPDNTIPCVVLPVDSDLQAFEIEYAENSERMDLTWQEKSQAISALHALRLKQNPEQTLTSTTEEILGAKPSGAEITKVSLDLELTKALQDNPELAKAKTKTEAVKILTRQRQAEHFKTLHEKFNLKDEGDSTSPYTLLPGDCLDQMEGLKPETFDCIITDPPYGIDADTFGEQANVSHDYSDGITETLALLDRVSDQTFRLAKPDAHLYLFCDPRNFQPIANIFNSSGWNVWPIPLIWNKRNGMLPSPDFAPRRTYECILFARKGQRKVLSVKADVITIPNPPSDFHGAQKPVDLYVELLSRSVYPGDIILDPFAGSGTVFAAAKELSLKATGIELNEEYVGYCVDRIEGLEKANVGDGDLK